MDVVPVGDIRSANCWQHCLYGVDSVVHLAGKAHAFSDRGTDPEAFWHINVSATEKLARAAASAGARRLVFVSSIKVNGECSDTKPFTVLCEPDPHGPYALSKLAAERVLDDVAIDTELEIVKLRPPLMYGPRVGGNIFRMLKWVSRGVPLPLKRIDNVRSLLNVKNLADLIDICIDHPNALGGTFLAADGNDLSTQELVERIADALEIPCRLFAVPRGLLTTGARLLGHASDVERLINTLQVDLSHTEQTLTWKPPHSVEQGLLDMVHWFKRHRETDE